MSFGKTAAAGAYVALLVMTLLACSAAAQQPVTAGTGQLLAEQAPSEQVLRQQTQPLNNAPVWREIRAGEAFYTSIKGLETGVLIQSSGETWRAWRNHYVVRYGGWALTFMVLIIALYYWRKGTVQLHEAPSGRRVERFELHERVIHWATAISFVVLAVSGLIMLFGRYILLPILGLTLFAWLAQIGKNLHNFVGPVFIVCAILLFFTFVRDNVPRRYDWVWIRKFGGLFSGEHVPTHRFNAGEKAWFWGGLTFLGILVGASGLVLDFPNLMQTRATMQLAHLIHTIGAVLFMLGALGHVYMGTIGVAGAYRAMRTGDVDEAWLKEHHDLFYDDIQTGKVKVDPSVRSPTRGSIGAVGRVVTSRDLTNARAADDVA